jgi:hypothetical protein
LRIEDKLPIRASSSLVRHAPTQITWLDRVKSTKNSPQERRIVFNAMAEFLLNYPCRCDDDMNLACQEALPFFETCTNIDELKYCLRAIRFKHHFLHTHTDQYKKDHLHIFREILYANNYTGIPDEIDAISAERIRKRLLTSPNIQLNIALLILAKYWPINTEDCITCDAISADDLVFTREGKAFDFSALMKYHEQRDVRYKNRFESATDKKLLDPSTNIPFNFFDEDHILRLAKKPPKHSDNDPLDQLYDLQVLSRVVYLQSELREMDLGKINLARLARVNEEDQKRLIENIEKYSQRQSLFAEDLVSNQFYHRMTELIANGLSIEQFAKFSTQTQEAMTGVWQVAYKTSPQ